MKPHDVRQTHFIPGTEGIAPPAAAGGHSYRSQADSNNYLVHREHTILI